jgi:TRAP-type uncharacterized transport system substrate-binding protein
LRAFLRAFAVLLALIAIGGGVSYFVLRPTEFKVAVPASNPLDQRVFGAAAEMLRSQRAPVRLEVVVAENTKAAMEMLETAKVNFAVVRSDAALLGRAHTVMIMRTEVAVLFAPKVGKLQKVTDLPNAMIGVARDGPLDGNLLMPVLDYYGIPRDKAKFVAVKSDELATAFRQKKVDGIIAVGAVSSKQMSEVIAEAAKGVKGAIQFIDIEEADAIAKRIPALDSIEVDQGAFGGRPPRPAESFNTLGYSVRLIATPRTETESLAELVRQLYLIRQNVSATIPGAGLMATPDVDEATSFLIHPGVRAYVNGDQKSWFERYSDYIYLFLFVGSGLGSVAAGMLGLRSKKREGDDPAEQLNKVPAVLEAVRAAPNAEELAQLEREGDEIFRTVYAHGVKDEISAPGIASFDMAMTELRARIAARRAELKAG